jgi:phosphomannomutase / phosphoglucomutase
MASDTERSTGSSRIEIDPNIVRGYDVRGYIRPVVAGGKTRPQNLTPEVAEAFGRAIGSMVAVGGNVAVTSDHRQLSDELVAGLSRGFTRVGVNVLHNQTQEIYGSRHYLPTGALSWFLIKSRLDGSVQVTGSHNPPEFNGFKISVGLRALFGEELQRVIPVIREGRFRPDVSVKQRGQINEVDMLGQYLDMLRRAFPRFARPARVIVDAGNGIGRVITPVLRAAGCQVEEMFAEPLSTFPNHLADPSSDEGTRALRDRVRALNAKLGRGERPWIGIALDGDSDRSGFVDEGGAVVWPERMAAVFYANYLANPAHAGHMLALDVRASNVVRDSVVSAGGRGVFIPAGYPSHRKFASLESTELRKTRVEVSAEASGHFFFPTAAMDENGARLEHGRDYLIDDGIFSALRFLAILDERQGQGAEPATVRGLMSSLPTYATSSELRLYVPDEVKNGVVQDMRDELVRRYARELANQRPMQEIEGLKIQDGDAAIVEVDGIRLQFSDGAWLVVRVSNTSPNIVVKFEAGRKDRLLELMRVVRDLLARNEQVELASLDEEIARWQ